MKKGRMVWRSHRPKRRESNASDFHRPKEAVMMKNVVLSGVLGFLFLSAVFGPEPLVNSYQTLHAEVVQVLLQAG